MRIMNKRNNLFENIFVSIRQSYPQDQEAFSCIIKTYGSLCSEILSSKSFASWKRDHIALQKTHLLGLGIIFSLSSDPSKWERDTLLSHQWWNETCLLSHLIVEHLQPRPRTRLHAEVLPAEGFMSRSPPLVSHQYSQAEEPASEVLWV